MTAMEKAFWWEMTVAIISIALVVLLFPFIGDAARGGFGVLGFSAIAIAFLRQRRGVVVVDERDSEIEKMARHWGIIIAAGLLYGALTVIVCTGTEVELVSKTLLSWLLWFTFAICLFAKGLIGIVAYRKSRYDAQS